MPEDNEEVKATLLEGNTRYSSAARVMGNVATELGSIIASVDLSINRVLGNLSHLLIKNRTGRSIHASLEGTLSKSR